MSAWERLYMYIKLLSNKWESERRALVSAAESGAASCTFHLRHCCCRTSIPTTTARSPLQKTKKTDGLMKEGTRGTNSERHAASVAPWNWEHRTRFCANRTSDCSNPMPFGKSQLLAFTSLCNYEMHFVKKKPLLLKRRRPCFLSKEERHESMPRGCVRILNPLFNESLVGRWSAKARTPTWAGYFGGGREIGMVVTADQKVSFRLSWKALRSGHLKSQPSPHTGLRVTGS